MSTGWLRGIVKAVPSGDQVVVVAPSANPVRARDENEALTRDLVPVFPITDACLCAFLRRLRSHRKS
jgi:hypothetical protein